MERHIRDVLEEEVIYDQSQFGLLNSQIDESSLSPPLLSDPSRNKKPLNKMGKLTRTAALCGAYISLGLCMSVTGPTLLYLKDQVGSTISEISYIFTVRSIGTLGGAFFGGFFLDRCNPYSAFFVAIASMAISVGAMPWCKHVWMLMVSSFVVGVGNGLLDTGASTLCLQLWGRESGPYMQALHFSFAVGGSIAPLLVQAFIVETSTTTVNNTISSRHVRSVTNPLNSSESEDQMTTIASIIKATSEIPVLVTSNLTIPSSNSTIPTASNSTFGDVTSTTTISPVVNQNQTTPLAEKPKKPKPAVINGQILGPSKQFDNTPLKVETPPPQEVVVTTTTAPSNENQTTPAITLTSTDITTILPSINGTTKAQDAGANMTEITMILQKSNEVQGLNISSSDNNTLTVSSKNASESTGNDTVVSSSLSPVTESSTMTTIPLTSLEPVINSSNSNAEFQPKETAINNVTKGADLDVKTFPTTTPTTTTPLYSSTTSQSTTAVLTSTSKTTTPSSIELLLTTIKNISLPIPVATAMPVDLADNVVVKSRGKSRGQQDEVSSAVPSTTLVLPVTFSEPTVLVTTTTNSPIHNESETIDRSPVKVSDYLERFGVTRMHMLYTVIAIIVLHTAFFFLFFLCSGTRNSTAERQTSDRKVKPFRPCDKISFVVLMFSFYLMYVGSEVVFAQFLTTFALESPLKLSTSTANYITTTFWASFAAARFVAIFVAHFTNPTAMLIFNLCSTAFGSITLCVAGQTDATILYVGSALVGVGMASTFATGFIWTETHLLVTNRISAAFSVASSMGEMIFPTVTGALIESNPLSLMYIVLGCTIFITTVFFVAWYLAKRKGRSFSSNSRGYHLARQAEDESAQN